MLQHATRLFYLIAGWISLALGIIGIFLPILPTAPFVLLAAFLFSKGSKRAYNWLVTRPALGPMIVEWETKGIIRRRAKIFATTAIAVTGLVTMIVAPVGIWIKAAVAMILGAVAWFVNTRPEE